jgi:hypothetical protein
MPKPKSVLPKLTIDEAARSHSCQHNKNHKLKKGDKRLKIKVNRAYEHYCSECAIKTLERDISILTALVEQLRPKTE